MSIDAMKQALAALDDVLQLSAEHSEVRATLRAAIEQEPMMKQPTKIFGPNLEEILNLAGFYKKREWQGLTRQEFLDATKGLEDLEDCWIAIEAALRSKNT